MTLSPEVRGPCLGQGPGSMTTDLSRGKGYQAMYLQYLKELCISIFGCCRRLVAMFY